jgi:predicted dehydrogenase
MFSASPAGVQAGLQRRYSSFYQVARMMAAKGLIGNVTHIAAPWHRNPGWLILPDPASERSRYWMIFREYSAGLAGELASHQIDVASWRFNAQPEYVMGMGGPEFIRDGRDIYDNIQLLYRFRKGRKLIYSAIGTNQHLPLFGGTRAECGETIMGTGGTIEITLGAGREPCIALWYYEPRPPVVARGAGYVRRWLYSKGVTLPEEDRNPVDVQMESFFDCCRTGGRPKADVDAGLANSAAVILSNLAMDEERRVYFNEMERLGLKVVRNPSVGRNRKRTQGLRREGHE